MRELDNETESLLSSYNTETERLRLESLNRWKPEVVKNELVANLDSVIAFDYEIDGGR